MRGAIKAVLARLHKVPKVIPLQHENEGESNMGRGWVPGGRLIQKGVVL